MLLIVYGLMINLLVKGIDQNDHDIGMVIVSKVEELNNNLIIIKSLL